MRRRSEEVVEEEEEVFKRRFSGRQFMKFSPLTF